MEQKAHIERLIKESDKRAKSAVKIQKSYEQCLKNFNDKDFSDLVTELEITALPWVRKQLWQKGCYSEENEHAVLQEARLGLWQMLIKDNDNSVKREMVVSYAFGIYKKKTLGIIRTVTHKKGKMDVRLFSEPVGNTGKTQEDMLPIAGIDGMEQKESCEMYKEVFEVYCKTLLTSFMSRSFLPKNLALYYARVLPHLFDEILDTKATSAKYAFEKMRGWDIKSLKINSESTLQQTVCQELYWGEEYVQQLEEEIDVGGVKVLLKNIIYTEVYSKEKIEDWADYLHKVVIAKAKDIILKDEGLAGVIKSYISKDDILYCFVREGESR